MEAKFQPVDSRTSDSENDSYYISTWQQEIKEAFHFGRTSTAKPHRHINSMIARRLSPPQ